MGRTMQKAARFGAWKGEKMKLLKFSLFCLFFYIYEVKSIRRSTV